MRASCLALPVLIVVAAATTGVASADVNADVTKAFSTFVDGVAGPSPALDGVDLFITPGVESESVPDLTLVRQLIPKPKVKVIKVVASKGGKSAWIATEIAATITRNGKAKADVVRASAFLALGSAGWKVVATEWSVGVPDQVIEGCGMLTYEWEVEPKVPDAVAAPVKALIDALDASTSAQFVALMSDDKNTQVFGSAPKEKFAGGKAIKGVFKKWKVGLSFHDPDHPDLLPARAGVGPDGELIWVAVSIMSPWQLCTTYRGFFVLAHEKSGWKIVHQHYADKFSAE